MKRLIPTYGAKIHNNGDGRRKTYDDDEEYDSPEYGAPNQPLDLESQLSNPYNPNLDQPGKLQTPRMSYSELQAENKFPNSSNEALSFVSSNDDQRLLPTSNFQPANYQPSQSSHLINEATKLGDNHLVAFAKYELERLKSQGMIKSTQPLDGLDGGSFANHPPLAQKKNGTTVSANPQERAMINAFDTLSDIFPSMEESLLMSKDQESKTLFLQKMVNRAANKTYDIPGSAPPPPFHTTTDILASYLAVLTKFEMKQAICKAILSICKSPNLKGIDATVPFLGSSKFPLQHRLFVLKLLTKEFGLKGESKESALNLPMVMSMAIEAVLGNKATKQEKIHHAAIMLIVEASLSVGSQRVSLYLRLKKVPEEIQSLLISKIQDGEARHHVKERKRAKRRHAKEQMRKFKEGEERRQSMAGDILHSPDFKSQTTYFSTTTSGIGEDEDLMFSSSSSDEENQA